MSKPGRKKADLDDYLDWQQRLEKHEASGLSIEVFCLQQGFSRSTFHRWARQLKDGIPEPIAADAGVGVQAPSDAAGFLPVSIKASPVEFELPNGGIVRFPLSVGQEMLLKVTEVVATLRPWKAPKS